MWAVGHNQPYTHTHTHTYGKKCAWVPGYIHLCMRVCVCVERFFVPLLFCEKPLMHDITVSLSLSHMSAMSVCGKQLCIIILYWDKRYRTVAWSIWPTESTAVDSLQSVNADFLGQLIIRKASVTVSVSLSIGRGSCKASMQTLPSSLLLVWQPRASDDVIIYVSRGDFSVTAFTVHQSIFCLLCSVS